MLLVGTGMNSWLVALAFAAALDDANIDRFIKCLRQFDGIQFTLVTHQKATMEQADVLYGVTMPEKGVSKVLSLSLEDDLSKYSN